MPRMLVLGRRVDLSSDDVTCPAATSLFWRAVWVCLLVTVIVTAHSTGNLSCGDAAAPAAVSFLVLYLAFALSVVGLGLDATMCRRSMRGTIVDDAPRAIIPRLVHAHVLIGLADILPYAVGVGTSASSLLDPCDEVPQTVRRALQAAAIAGLVITSLFIAAVAILWCRGSSPATQVDADVANEAAVLAQADAALTASSARWSRRCRACSFLCRTTGFGALGGANDTFENVGTVLAGVFAAVDSLNLTTSDLIAGLALVRLVQKAEEVAAKRQAAPAALDTDGRGRPHTATPSTITLGRSSGGTDSSDTPSNRAPTLPSHRSRSHSHGRKHDEGGARLGGVGAVPSVTSAMYVGTRPLDMHNSDDVRVLDEAAHYASYSVGAYGWMLFAWMHMCTWPCRLPGWACWYCMADSCESWCRVGPLEWQVQARSLLCCGQERVTMGMGAAAHLRTVHAVDVTNPYVHAYHASHNRATERHLIPQDVCGCNEVALRRMMSTALAVEALNRAGMEAEAGGLEARVVAAGAPMATRVDEEGSASMVPTVRSRGVTPPGGGGAPPSSTVANAEVGGAPPPPATAPLPGVSPPGLVEPVGRDKEHTAVSVGQSPHRPPPSTPEFTPYLAPNPPFHHTDVLSVSHTNRFGTVPWFVAVDRGRRALVITVRGTLSFDDCITDALAHPRRVVDDPGFQALGLQDHWPTFPWRNALVHSGMWDAAKRIAAHVVRAGYLDLVAGDRLDSARHPRLQLIICGHSLGSGVCALLSLMLMPKVPSLRAYAFAPPGALVSAQLADLMAGWVVSLVIGKDMVPRASLLTLQTLMRETVTYTCRCTVTKNALLASAMLGVCAAVGPPACRVCCTTRNAVKCVRCMEACLCLGEVAGEGGGGGGSTHAASTATVIEATHPGGQDSPDVEQGGAVEDGFMLQVAPGFQLVETGVGGATSTLLTELMLPPGHPLPDTTLVHSMRQLRRREVLFLTRLQAEHQACIPPAKAGTPSEGGGVDEVGERTPSPVHSAVGPRPTSLAPPPTHGAPPLRGMPSTRSLFSSFHTPMYVPGRVLHMVRIRDDIVAPCHSLFTWLCCGRGWLATLIANVLCCCCRVRQRRYEPRWSHRTALNRIQVSADMLRDHMPDVIAHTIQHHVARLAAAWAPSIPR